MISSQRHFFTDLRIYSKFFNIIPFHGNSLTYIKNSDSLILDCSFTNNRDISSGIQVFRDNDGYLLLKTHDASFYQYLSITTSLVDEYRSYEATYDYHPSLDELTGPYADIRNQINSQSQSPNTSANLYKIILLRHSVLCRELFRRLYYNVKDGKVDGHSTMFIEVCFAMRDDYE